jgi:hypothetical protein
MRLILVLFITLFAKDTIDLPSGNPTRLAVVPEILDKNKHEEIAT